MINHDVVYQEHKNAEHIVHKYCHNVDPSLAVDKTYTCVMLFDASGNWSKESDMYPNTVKEIRAVFGKHLFQAFLVTMIGPKFMAPHRNTDTNGYLRYHLGVDVHQQCDSQLKTQGRVHKWAQGKWFVFDTTKTHSVYKSSDYKRTILAVDFDAAAAEALLA